MLFLRKSRSLFRFILPALLLAVSWLLFFPFSTQAHAILYKSNPSKDAVLQSSPDRVQMWFTEDLNPTFSTAVVLNGAKQHMDKGDARVTAGDTKEMDLSLKPNLPPAVYAVVWRTQSADDGHVLTGSFVFTIARADGSVPTSNGVTLPGTDALGGASANSGAYTGQLDGPTFFSFIMVTLMDLGVVFWVGAQLWRTFVLQLSDVGTPVQTAVDQRAEQRFARLFAIPVLLLLFFANIGVLIGQGLLLTGGRFDQVFGLLGPLASNGRFGTYWSMREIVILLALALAAYTLWSRRRSQVIDELLSWANLVLGLALLIAVSLSGHAAAVSGNVLVYAVLVDWLHLLAASLWIGGMMYLSAVYMPALKGHTLAERTRTLLATLPHFSPLAIAGVVIMAVTGPFNAVVHMESFDQLVTTAYGRALSVKVLLVGALLLTSAVHVGWFRPRLARAMKRYEPMGEAVRSGEAQEDAAEQITALEMKQLERNVASQTQRLTGVLRWEPVLGIGVLLCTGLMNVFAGTLLPPAPVQPQQPTTPSKPFSTTVQTSDNQFTIKLNVSPNRFGTNVFTVSVLDSNGAPDTNVGVSIYPDMLDMQMQSDPINLQPDGKGHFSASGDLSMGGNWELRIQIRTVQNTLHEGTVKLFTPF